ncbi:hypothetical protein [Streptomyces sp. 6N223]
MRGSATPLAVSTYAALPPEVRELLPSAADFSRVATDAMRQHGEGLDG